MRKRMHYSGNQNRVKRCLWTVEVVPICNPCISFSEFTSCHNLSIWAFTSFSSAAASQHRGKKTGHVSFGTEHFAAVWRVWLPPDWRGDTAFLIREGRLQLRWSEEEQMRRRTGKARRAMSDGHSGTACSPATLQAAPYIYWPSVCLSGCSPCTGSNSVCFYPNIRQS